jgi:hypothetical protein
MGALALGTLFPDAAAGEARRRGNNATNSLSAGCQVSKSRSDSIGILSFRVAVQKGRGVNWKRKLFRMMVGGRGGAIHPKFSAVTVSVMQTVNQGKLPH